MRIKLTLSYNGAAFSGWQTQTNAPSVQGTLEDALATLLGTSAAVTGAGRTDTGVNAINYVAHFDAESEDGILIGRRGLPLSDLPYRLNAVLPREIAVQDACRVDENFHARFSATARTYKYFIHFRKDPFLNAFSWECHYRLDLEKMNEACTRLYGGHDCSCFEKKGSDNLTSICTIYSALWEEDSRGGMIFTIKANRFLRNMVRAIVGTMVDIGRGVNSPEYITSLLENGTRSDAGQSVPGHALFLTGIDYPD